MGYELMGQEGQKDWSYTKKGVVVEGCCPSKKETSACKVWLGSYFLDPIFSARKRLQICLSPANPGLD